MKQRTLFVIAIMLATMPVTRTAPAKPQNRRDIESEIRAAETDRFRALTAGDLPALERALSDDLVYRVMLALPAKRIGAKTMWNQTAAPRFLRPYAVVLVLTAAVFAPPAGIGAPAIAGAGTDADAANEPEGSATVEIKELIAKYAAAVNVEPVDFVLASQVWSNSPEVSLIYPLGEERGWEQVKRNFYQNTMGALFAERKLTPRDITVHAYGDSAWAEFSWHFVAKLRKTGPLWRPADGRRRFTGSPAQSAGFWFMCTIRPCRRSRPPARQADPKEVRPRLAPPNFVSNPIWAPSAGSRRKRPLLL